MSLFNLKLMNRNFFAGLFVGLGLLAIVAFKPAGEKIDAPLPPAQKWEYFRVPFATAKVADAQLKVAGMQGWELEAIAPNGDYLFKRPL